MLSLRQKFRDMAYHDAQILLKADQVTIGYKQHGGALSVAENLSFEMQTSQFICLAGPNGAGKSTLLRTLAGFQPLLAGTLFIGQRKLTAITPRELSQLLSIVLTDRPQLYRMSVFDVVAMGCQPYTGFFGRLDRNHKKQVYQALEQTGITQLKNRLFEELSDGERQKCMIAKSLAQQTPIILLDEPSAFLDYPAKTDLMALLKQLSRDNEKLIIMSTHDLNLALSWADKLMLLSPFKPFKVYTPQQLLDSDELAAFFNRDDLVFDPQKMIFIHKEL